MRHEKGKTRRRKRIVEEATTLLASDDQTLSLRTLAAASNVTVPTIYNLIGNKADVMLAVCHDIVFKHREKMDGYNGNDPLKLLQDMICWSAKERRNNDRLYRATYLAWDELMRSKQLVDEVLRIMNSAAANFTIVVGHAQDQGLLEGHIAAELLGMQIYQLSHDAALQWAYRRISVAEYERRSLLGLYLTLLADAPESLRTQLEEKIDGLHIAPDDDVELKTA